MSAEYITVGGLKLDESCAKCSGAGVVAAQEWVDFTEKWQAAGSPSLYEWEKENPPPIHVNEEHACPECEGSGFTLTRDGQRLLAFLRRHRESF